MKDGDITAQDPLTETSNDTGVSGPERRRVRRLRSAFAADSAVACEYQRLAGLHAQLSQPNVVDSFGMKPGDPVGWVLAAAEGSALSRWTERRRPLAPAAALHVAMQVLRGLSAGHGLGLVHRDLRPDNVMVNEGGSVVLGEFGAWGVVQAQARARLRFEAGLLAYDAPEVVEQVEADGRADLFSAGVLLYELLSGVHPFRANGAMETSLAIVTAAPVPLDRLRPNLPTRLVQAVAFLMAKDADERFQSADAAANALSTVDVGPVEPTDLAQWMGDGPRPDRGRTRELSFGGLVGSLLAKRSRELPAVSRAERRASPADGVVASDLLRAQPPLSEPVAEVARPVPSPAAPPPVQPVAGGLSVPMIAVGGPAEGPLLLGPVALLEPPATPEAAGRSKVPYRGELSAESRVPDVSARAGLLSPGSTPAGPPLLQSAQELGAVPVPSPTPAPPGAALAASSPPVSDGRTAIHRAPEFVFGTAVSSAKDGPPLALRRATRPPASFPELRLACEPGPVGRDVPLAAAPPRLHGASSAASREQPVGLAPPAFFAAGVLGPPSVKGSPNGRWARTRATIFLPARARPRSGRAPMARGFPWAWVIGSALLSAAIVMALGLLARL